MQIKIISCGKKFKESRGKGILAQHCTFDSLATSPLFKYNDSVEKDFIFTF